MMKHNIKSILMIGAFMLVVESAPAQSKLDKLMTETTPEERAELQSKNMQDRLSLSEDQYQQVQAINLKYAHKMQSIYAAGQGKLQRLKSMKTVSEDKDLELKRVLHPEQYETYRKQREEMRDHSKKKKRGQ